MVAGEEREEVPGEGPLGPLVGGLERRDVDDVVGDLPVHRRQVTVAPDAGPHPRPGVEVVGSVGSLSP